MAHFERYNTSDSTTGQTTLAGMASMPAIVLSTEQDGILVGTMISDQAGTLNVDQSFDYNPNTGSGHWDYSATYAVTANTGIKISESIIAPYCRVRYTNGATPQTFMRLFIRCFGTKTG